MTELSNQTACPCCGAPIDPVGLFIDVGSGLVTHGGQTTRLTPAQTKILQIIVAAYPKVVAKEAIYDELYSLHHDDEQPVAKVIDVFVCKMRSKLGPLGVIIATAWGVGYSLSFRNHDAAKAMHDAALERRSMRPWKPGDDQRLRELSAAGLGLTAIAQQLGVSYAAVDRAIARLGLYRGQRAG